MLNKIFWWKYKPKNRDQLRKLVADESIKLWDIDTSLVADMSNVFSEAKQRTNFDGIETWDVSNVTDMSYIFYNCEYFNQNINSWDVSNVINMERMFAGCNSFNQPLDKWDVSNVTDMEDMFLGCFEFNQPLNTWDVKNVKTLRNTFSKCKSFNQDLSNWKLQSATNLQWMFLWCDNFNWYIWTWDWNSSLSSLIKNGIYNQPLLEWAIWYELSEYMLNIIQYNRENIKNCFWMKNNLYINTENMIWNVSDLYQYTWKFVPLYASMGKKLSKFKILRPHKNAFKCISKNIRGFLALPIIRNKRDDMYLWLQTQWYFVWRDKLRLYDQDDPKQNVYW